MKHYLFKTTTTMKPYNNKKWWIDSKYVRDFGTYADSVKEALKKYIEEVKEKYCIEISPNALKTKEPMYIDTLEGAKQVGYVITGSS